MSALEFNAGCCPLIRTSVPNKPINNAVAAIFHRICRVKSRAGQFGMIIAAQYRVPAEVRHGVANNLATLASAESARHVEAGEEDSTRGCGDSDGDRRGKRPSSMSSKAPGNPGTDSGPDRRRARRLRWPARRNR